MLQITDLKFSFGQHIIYDGLNATFRTGQISGIVGKNGVGKTTLFRILSSIYQNQGGNITLNGQKLDRLHLTFMPAEPYFYPFMKGKEYLQIVANSDDELTFSVQIASALDLPLNELVDNYSTGMRKKLAFAGHFALQKSIIILDEPYNGVDLESNEVIKHIIKTQSQQKIVILSSHILSTITDICDDVYYFTENRVVTRFEHAQFDSLERSIEHSMGEKLKLLDIKG